MIYRFEGYELDMYRYELRRASQPCPLEPQVFDVLAYLVRHRDRVVTKQELFDQVWGDRVVSEAALSSRLMAARKAVGDSGQAQRLIRTVHGRGYRFVAPVEEQPSDGPETAAATTLGAAARQMAADQTSLRLVPPSASSFTLDTVPPNPASTVAHGLPEVARVVGRTDELRRLQQALDVALGGRRQIVFVTGEPGLGKTTLVEAFLAEARRQAPIAIGRGQCLEHRGVGEAYMPMLDALGRLCREAGGQHLVTLLARHAPTWLVQMPWLVDAEELARLHSAVVGATRERMLREMVETLDELTKAQPLVLVLEDLHWSDYATLDLLAWLGRRPEPARLLVIGTYRPADAKTRGHPLHAVAQELTVRGYGTELALSFLTEAAIDEYLTTRFPGVALPAGLAGLVHQRTEGNPLFMINVVDAWLARGALAQVDGQCRVQVGLTDLVRDVPESLRQLIDQHLQALDPKDQVILEAASVAGMAFSAAAVAAGLGQPEEHVEARCDGLARQGQFLVAGGPSEWPDGTIATGYRFIHHLYQEVLYDQLPAGRQVRLHRQIGARLEAGYGPHARDHAAELAVHFVQGRDPQRAIRYLQYAAEQAVQRRAPQAAIEHLTSALDMLQRLPDGAERLQQEVALQLMLAPVLIATKGWAAPEAERAYVRAQAICEQLGDPPQAIPVLYGLATLYEMRGDYQASQRLMEQRLRKPRDRSGDGLLLESHELLACSLFHQGAFVQALDHAEQGVNLYDPRGHHALPAVYGDDPGIACHNWAALSLWFLGYPDQAQARAFQALQLAEARGHFYSLATAQAQAAFLYMYRQEDRLARTWAEATIALSTEQGFAYRAAMGMVVRGWALARQGQHDEGLSQLRQGLAASRAMGAEMDYPAFLALLAEVYASGGQTEAALAALAEALALLDGSRSFFFEAELQRLKGHLLMQTGGRAAWDQAEVCFHHALAIAQRQQAQSLALRAAVSLGELWRQQGRQAEAHQLLFSTYGWFSEGYDTADLRRARALLAALAPALPEQ